MKIRWRASALLALAYVVTGELGRLLHLIEGTTIFIWPPAGVSLAAVMLLGPGLWPGVAAGTFVMVLLFGPPVEQAVCIAAFEVGEVLLAWWLLARFFRFRTSLSRVHDVISLSVVALVTSLLSAAAGVTVVTTVGTVPAESRELLFYSWWWSHVSADLVIAPVLMTWRTRSTRRDTGIRPSFGEIVALVACVAVADIALFSSWLPSSQAPFYLLPVPLWAGLRFGPRGAATATFAIGSMAIASVTTGRGPFISLGDLEGFVSITSVATLLLSAMAVEKDRASLRRSAVQLAALDAIVSVDTAGRIVEFNPAAEQLFGYRASEVIGRNVRMLMAGNQEAFAQQRYSTTARRADGSELPIEISVAEVTFEGEDIRTGFIRDRSDELRAHNNELERSESMLRQAEELAQLGSFELDLMSGRLVWSDELYRIFGHDRATFTPNLHSFFAAIHPEDRAAVRATFAAAIKNVESFSLEGRMVRPGGVVRTLIASGRVHLDGATVARRLTGCCQDVTDRKAAEEARYRFVDIAESSEDAIIGLSPQGEIETWNAAAASIFGYTRAEVIGGPCTLLAAADSVADLRERIRLAAEGRRLSHYELLHRRKNGSVFPASVTTSAIRDSQGKVIGLSKVLRDISEQKSSEKQLQASLDEKEVLLREIHHRVKNNLQVISSLLNLQVSTETSPQSRRSLLESQNRIQSMALVHQLLYQSTDIGRIDLTAYVRTLTNRLLRTYSVGPDRIELTVRGPSILLGIDRVIPCGLIVNELVANAIDHAFPHERRGHIWVTIAHETDSDVALTVSDDGVGIPADLAIERAQTFGLQIARTLTRQLDGSIALARQHGTIARLTFPVHLNTNAAATVH